MAVYVIETSETQQRMLPNDLLRLISDESVLLGRLTHYITTGEHTPSVSFEVQSEAWYSVYREGGASQNLINIMRNTLELWPSLVCGYKETFSRLAQENLQVGDRIIVHGEDRYPGYSRLRYNAVTLDEKFSIILERAFFSHNVIGYFSGSGRHTRHSHIVEALAQYRSQVYSIISEPRLWRADGRINEKKAVKLLCDNVSTKFGEITGAELEAIALHWKSSNGFTVRPLSAGDKGKAFEDEVEHTFLACGFAVETTASSGDYGVDLVVSDGRKRFAVQVKNLAVPVGISAVQEVSAGALHYRCDHTLVVVNNGFTEAARVLAHSTGTRLETLHSLRQHLRQQLVELLTG